MLPLAGTDFTLRIGFAKIEPESSSGFLLANFNSFVFDYCSRQLLGGTHLSDYVLKQLPVIPISTYAYSCQWQSSQKFCEWFLLRVLELTYTAHDLQGFAADCGYTGEPFCWDEARRFLLCCELDAAYFHLYGIGREDVAYILDTFPIVRRKDEAQHGEYRTQRVILEIYDAMQQAITTGQPYQTLIDPPPANGWTPPELPKEEVNTKPVPPPAMPVKETQPDLFAWQAEDPQQELF